MPQGPGEGEPRTSLVALIVAQLYVYFACERTVLRLPPGSTYRSGIYPTYNYRAR